MTEQGPSGEARVRNMRRWPASAWIIAGVLFLGVAFAGIRFLATPAPAWVEATEPEYQDLVSAVSTGGRVVPQHEFIARANFPGAIEGIDVHLGQTVSAGQSLVRMKDPYAASRVAAAASALQATEVGYENVHSGGNQEEIINLRSDLARAQAEQSAAEASLATMTQLQSSGAASAAEIRAATQRLAAAQHTTDNISDRMTHRFSAHDVASWNARLADARSGLASAKASFANTNITSPIAGTVYLMPVTSNDFVGVGAELLRVADLQKLEVHASFEEAEMGRLHEGAATEIRWDGRPERVWHGVITHAPMAAVISGVRSVGEAIISITDAKNDLPPNSTVMVTVVQERRPHVLTLPREALQTKGATTFVYRIVNGTLVRTPVIVGLMNLDRFQVVQGVGSNDQVALHALDNRELIDGMPVRVKP